MGFGSGSDVYEKIKNTTPIPTGDAILDELIGGGLFPNLTYLFYFDIRITSNILLRIAVNCLKIGETDPIKVAFVDAVNRFDPYKVSKLAISQHMSPRKTLENILISRAFTWDQMVELLENQLVKLENIKMYLISGVTSLFANHEQKSYHELLQAISGVKKVLSHGEPTIVLTAPLHKKSSYKPVGGNILYHFGTVLVAITDTGRFVEYNLIQHPFMAEKQLKSWKPRKSKRGLAKPLRNSTMDSWLTPS